MIASGRPGHITVPLHAPLPQYAAEKYGAAEIVDPRPFLVGSMLWTYKKVSGAGCKGGMDGRGASAQQQMAGRPSA